VADVPVVAVRPPLVCCFHRLNPPPEYCAIPAVRMRLTPGAAAPQFFCAYHCLPTDEPITDEATFHLVSVTMEVRLCGVSETPGVAHAEALARLEAAIGWVGGVINMHACRSMLARAEPPTPVGPQKGEGGRGQ
jgi:hypothetical protein